MYGSCVSVLGFSSFLPYMYCYCYVLGGLVFSQLHKIT